MSTATQFPERERVRRKLDKLKALTYEEEPASLQVDLDSGEFFLSGPIGKKENEVSAAMFTAAIRQFKGRPFKLFLNSVGGSVDEAVEIANSVESHGAVDIYVTSLAASAASFILQFARRRYVFPNACVMIHACWSTVLVMPTITSPKPRFCESMSLDWSDNMQSVRGSRKQRFARFLTMNFGSLVEKLSTKVLPMKWSEQNKAQPNRERLRKSAVVAEAFADHDSFVAACARSRTSIARSKIARAKIAIMDSQLEIEGFGPTLPHRRI